MTRADGQTPSARAATEPPGTGAAKPRRALITRPREDSQAVATALAELGFAVQIEPLLDIRPIEGASVDTEGVQGILATSANGIRALARTLAARDLPVWAVGDASARVARELGYGTVESAGGDVETLAALVSQRCKPEDGAFLHAAGTVTAGDLSGSLERAGFSVRRVVLYQAETAEHLSDELKDALNAGSIDAALFFSPRTAATFVTLVKAAGLADTTKGVGAYCLSQAVARELAALSWAAVHVAAAPTQAALLAALSATIDRGSAMTETDAQQPAEQASPETSAQPSAKGSSLRALLVAALLAAIIGAAALTFESWKSLLDSVIPPQASAPTATSGQAPAPAQVQAQVPPTDPLRAELTALRERLAQLEARPAASAERSGDPISDQRLTQTEGRLKALEAMPQLPVSLVGDVRDLAGQVGELKRTSADAATVLRLADRLEKIEARLSEVEAKRTSAVALLLAVGQLREAVGASMPFDSELRAVKALAGTDEEIARAVEILKGRAVTGLPTRSVLMSRFHAAAPAIVRADILPTEHGWWRQTLDRLATLVSIRREDGMAEGADTPAIIARATARLGDGDLAAALAEMNGLQGAAAETAAPWLIDARDRLAAERALSEMTAHVIAAIGAKP